MPRFTLTFLFGLITLAAVIASLFADWPTPIQILIVFWPMIGAFAWVLLHVASVSHSIDSMIDENPQMRQHHEAYGEWRKGMLLAGMIIQAVWLPFGLALAFAIGVTIAGGI